MKNLLTSISLLIIIIVGFSSCETASIMKRHYNKGYYVSKKHKPSDVKTNPSLSTEQAPAIEPEVIEKIAQRSENAQETEPAVVVPKKDERFDHSSSKQAKKQLMKEAGVANAFSPKNMITSPFSIKKNLKEAVAQDDVARDALSLLWILILILLIAYVVGLIFDLFGLGPVFHILGAIVLILLILWLLRII
jgi:hypothetical protein